MPDLDEEELEATREITTGKKIVNKLVDMAIGDNILEKRIKDKLAEINDALEEESKKCKKTGSKEILSMLSYGQELLEELLEKN